METQVPCGEPRVLPFVGHGDDVSVVNVPPGVVAPSFASFRRLWHGRIAVQPIANHVVVVLLGPQQSRECLAHDAPGVGVSGRRDDRGIKLVSFLFSSGKSLLEVRAKRLLNWHGGFAR